MVAVLINSLLMLMLGICINNVDNNDLVHRCDLDILTYYAWTDGTVIYRYQPNETQTDVETSRTVPAKSDRYCFVGCSLFESGYGLCISNDHNGRWKSIDQEDEKYYKLANCSVTLNDTHDALIFHNIENGDIVSVLVPFPTDSVVNDQKTHQTYLENDIVTYLLEGKYETRDGKTIEFHPNTFQTTGTLFGTTSFKIGNTDGMPTMVLVINDQCYYIEKVYGGINLFLMNYESTDNCTNGEREGTAIDLQRTDDNFWPELTHRVLTIPELLYYAGYIPNGPYTDEEIQLRLQYRKDMLATMRNSIFARHGYIFKKEEWQRTFGAMSWYKPQYDNVSSLLSETERINIQLISILEKLDF